MNALIDQSARNEALEPTTSFLIDAPAGSGKTEILVKRYLTLLLTVEAPEQVLFNTFTVQASGEMKKRVYSALKLASSGQMPVIAYERELYDIAKRVLDVDKAKGWGLLEQKSRLNIGTNDSYFVKLANSQPLTSNVGGSIAVTKTPELLYLKAAEQLLALHNSDNEEFAGPVKKLLELNRNDFSKTSELISTMLASRDQWVHYVATIDSSMKDELESGLLMVASALTQKALDKLAPYGPLIEELLAYAVSNTNEIDDTHRTLFENFEFPYKGVKTVDDIRSVKAIAKLLTTTATKTTLRKSVNAVMGFPAPSKIKDKEVKLKASDYKDSYKVMMSELALDSDFTSALSTCQSVPNPTYSEEEWGTLTQLMVVLPLAIAQLKVVFREESQFDFTEVAHSAMRVMNTEDGVSDALLKVDRSIKHILVDEFQDTNTTQFKMYELMVSGWEPGDGRTITVVGDPMQAIYMFRGSNVNLFTRAIQNGIGDIKLKLLTLSSNFRSQSGVVEDVNAHFKELLPSKHDLLRGESAFNEAHAVKPKFTDGIEHITFSGKPSEVIESEAKYIVDSIQSIKLNEPNAKIAVLGRAKSDLTPISIALKTKKVGYKAVDMFKLESNWAVMDVISMAKALLNDDDRISWAAFLHSPLVGLTLQQIEAFTPPTDRSTFWAYLNSMSLQTIGNAETISLLQRMMTVVSQARAKFYRLPFSEILKGVFIELKGFSCLRGKTDLDAVDSFFNLMHELPQTLPTTDELERQIASAFEDQQVEDSSIQLMTQHKAKGLEFDYVFIPQCHKGSRSDSRSLLISDAILHEDGGATPILAPMGKSKSSEIYEFIRQYLKMKKQNEHVRLAYVAVTRAKVKTYLTGSIPLATKASNPTYREDSFFGILAAKKEVEAIESAEISEYTDSSDCIQYKLASYASRQLPSDNMLAEYRGIENINNDVLPPLAQSDIESQAFGTVYHKQIEMWVKHGVNVQDINMAQCKELWRNALIKEGVDATRAIESVKRLEETFTAAQSSENFQWLVTKRQMDYCELELSSLENGNVINSVLDRLFKDSGRWYLIDYKTNRRMKGEKKSAFVKRMKDEYENQMRRYTNLLKPEIIATLSAMLYLAEVDMFVEYDLEQLQIAA